MHKATQFRRLAAVFLLLVPLTTVLLVGPGNSLAGDGSANPPLNEPMLPGSGGEDLTSDSTAADTTVDTQWQ